MSKYRAQPLDLSALETVSLYDRGGKVSTVDFGRPHRKGSGISAWLDSLPKILAAESLRRVAQAIQEAKQRNKNILWGLGGHTIKCGLAPILIDLMGRGYATGFVLNGASSIHDFEIALAGSTSEDVEAVLPDGRFGSAAETGREMNFAIAAGARDGLGMGEALGRYLDSTVNPQFAVSSLLVETYRAATPVTVHVAIGTDTPHTHPAADPAAIGVTSHQDFRLLCSLVRGLDDGGVYLNVGSAVILPEVFLKAVSVVRNLKYPLAGFTTVNLDFLQHYRPTANVIQRPHAGPGGGKGYAITGHHEILIPLLAAILVEGE